MTPNPRTERTSFEPPGQATAQPNCGPEDLDVLMMLELYRREITAKELGLDEADIEEWFRRQE